MPRKITIEMEVEIREAPEDECLNHKDIANKAAHRFLKESPANITNIAVDEGYASFGYRLLPNTEELIQNDSGCIVEHITSQYRYEGEGQTCRQPTYYSSSSDPSQINNPLFVMAPVPEIPQTIAEDLSPTVPPTPTTADFPYPLIPSTHLADQQFTQPISTTSDRQHRRLASRRNLQPSDANAQDALKPQRGRSSKVEKVKRMKLPFQNPDFQKNVQKNGLATALATPPSGAAQLRFLNRRERKAWKRSYHLDVGQRMDLLAGELETACLTDKENPVETLTRKKRKEMKREERRAMGESCRPMADRWRPGDGDMEAPEKEGDMQVDQ